VSEDQPITVVVGRVEPIAGVERAELARIVARYAPQAPISGGRGEYDLLIRLKVSATKAGIVVAHPRDLSATMLLVAAATSLTSTPDVGFPTAVRATARRAPTHSNTGARFARVVPGQRALTGREAQVLEQLSRGRSNLEIANALHISVNTVIRHVARIFRKLGVPKRQQLLGIRAPDSESDAS
jgi:DNA-binding CsgD family transcriptional regulator